MADLSTVARPYAKALFEIASGERELAAWSAGLAAAAAIVSDARAHEFLARPGSSAGDRAEFVWSLCADVADAAILRTDAGRNLLRLLAENDRLAVLPEISAQFDALKAHAESKIRVTLLAATSVDAALSARIQSALQQRLGRSVELDVAVDETLLGGAIVKAEDRVIDGSVRSRLQRLAETLID
jgi:F-type H+-transporting ATPase subunit delta